MADISGLLDHLIETHPDNAPQIQLSYNFGLKPQAGVLTRTDFEGIYCLYQITETTGQQGGLRAGERVAVKEYFAASSVKTVIEMVRGESIVSPNA